MSTTKTKPKPKKSTDDERKAKWNRAMAMAALSESDIYCVGCVIEEAAPDLVIDVISLEEGHRADWNKLSDSQKDRFDPQKSTISQLLVNVVIPVSMCEPLGKQAAEQLRKLSGQLLVAADDLDTFEDYRDMAAMGKLAAGRLNARVTDRFEVEVLDRAGNVVPCEECEI
jgi:hypothetical protein